MTFRISGCIYSKDTISVDSNFLEVKDFEKNKTNDLTLIVDREREGQTYFYMAFLIFGCIRDTDFRDLPILTNSRSVISNKPKLVN